MRLAKLGNSKTMSNLSQKQIISFSLWGDNEKYTIGAIKNVELAPLIYPGWICRFYIAPTVPQDIVEQLFSYSHVEIVKLDFVHPWEGSFWRFYPASDPDVAVMISRDTDSRLNWREKAAVIEWLESERIFHIMHDHPQHYSPIMAGMWGIKGGFLPDIQGIIQRYLNRVQKQQIVYGIDQRFLNDIIFPLIKDRSLVHDEIFANKPFPTPRNQDEFVGQVFFADDTTPQGNIVQLKDYLNLRHQGQTLEAHYYSRIYSHSQ